uniref:Uncharacterized protein n=1 Tax=Arundo donax TaxID=35708 RepID=A0A0A8Y4Z0_ARUDO
MSRKIFFFSEIATSQHCSSVYYALMSWSSGSL